MTRDASVNRSLHHMTMLWRATLLRTPKTVPSTMRHAPGVIALVVCLGLSTATAQERSLEVTATAYNSLPGQGLGDPTLTAWGDELVPGERAVAVSRDLIPLGLTHGVSVEIEGLTGSYIVKDKLHKRWSRRIDIYMGVDEEQARQWGKRRVTIRW